MKKQLKTQVKTKTREAEELSVMEAVDELSKMAEIDHSLSPAETEGREIKQEKVKQTFRVLHNYLKHLYDKDKGHFQDQDTKHGVQAIMVIASEAAQKIDRFTVLFKGTHGEKGGVQELKEFQDLQEFYLTKIMKRFEATLASEKAWQAEWGRNGKEVDLLDIQRRGLKDLQTIRRDKDYDLFFIRKEDGHPFFNRNLMRHIRLIGEFDETITDLAGDDPFLRIKAIEDDDLHDAAKEILDVTKHQILSFYKEAMKHKEDPFIGAMNKAVMALFLAANPHNTLQNTMNKSAVRYFADYQRFLREALDTVEYQRALETRPEQMEPFMTTALGLIHRLAGAFFIRNENRKLAIEFIIKLFKKATEHEPLVQIGKNPLWLWNTLLDDDEKLRNLLKHYPNGPLMKTLDLLREGGEREGFDPLSQENLPHALFRVEGGVLSTEFLHLPAPVIQTHIDKAEVAKEFKAFLRSLSSMGKNEKLLLINVQDRTSWHEHARSHILEELQKNGEFSSSLVVVTLPLATDFYYQAENYETLDDAKTFMEQFLEQLTSGEACGFFFPSTIDAKALEKFAKTTADLIHRVFFAKKETLVRKNRLDFIEIFYQFLTLYLLEQLRPDYASFTCKDGIDTGAVLTGELYSLLKVLGRHPEWNNQEKELLLHLLYVPAIMLRERPVDKARLHRFVSALSLVQAELEGRGEKLRKEVNALYNEPLFDILNRA